MQQPPYFESAQFPNHVCRLRKSIYGLCQSPRVWYHRLHSFLLSSCYTRLYINASNFILIRLYVDDLPLVSNSLSYIGICKQELKASFPITDLGPMSYFLGIEVKRNCSLGTISLSQSQYISNIDLSRVVVMSITTPRR